MLTIEEEIKICNLRKANGKHRILGAIGQDDCLAYQIVRGVNSSQYYPIWINH